MSKKENSKEKDVKRFGVVKVTFDSQKLMMRLSKIGTDTKFNIELYYADYPDLLKNVEAFSSYLVDKAELILEQ